MATALFITPTDLKRNSLVDGNVDTDKFIQFIKIAQQIHIQNYLGTALYDRISADIIAGTLVDPYLNLVNEYIKDISENSESVTKNEVDTLIDKHRNFAQFYTRRFIDYMCFNNNLFPEYNANQNADMFPDTDANFVGWVL